MATDSLHMTPPRPSKRPATAPQMRQMAVSDLALRVFSSSMPSMSMLLPRDTIMATMPQAMAAAKDSPTSTRQATFPKGRITVHSQE
jgi:hypothetical protein